MGSSNDADRPRTKYATVTIWDYLAALLVLSGVIAIYLLIPVPVC